MKHLIVFAALLVSMTFVACSKDKGGGGAVAVPPNGQYGYNGGVHGPYAPGYQGHNCQTGHIPTIPYQHYYNGQPLQNNVNCLPGHALNGHNPFFIRYNIGFNLVRFAGTCDFRLNGPLCPPGYSCQPIGFGSQGVCSGGYYY